VVADSGMTLLRRAVRVGRPVVETLLAGVLLGVVVAVIVTQGGGTGGTSAAGNEVPDPSSGR
jgi:uncharacterized membrane protein